MARKECKKITEMINDEICDKDTFSLVVDIKNPAIQSKPLDGSDEKFRPWTSR